MKTLYTALRNDSHLKNDGRYQLSIFLKNIGLSTDDAYEFLKREFTKKMVTEDFDNDHGYRLRHAFGEEGSKKDYNGWTCRLIIQKQLPGNGEYHGCPFRYFADSKMKQLLGSYGISTSEIDIIL